jgi:hypothetical protein
MEILKWNGFAFRGAFTMGKFYDLCEKMSDLSDGVTDSSIGKSVNSIRLNFEETCKIVLTGESKEAQEYVDSGELAKAILNSEDVDNAFAFKGRIDFLSLAFMRQGTRLMKSAPDLTDTSRAKGSLRSTPKSPKGTKREPAHSG